MHLDMPEPQFLRQTVLSPSRLCWVILIYFPSVSDRKADWHLHDSLLQFLHSKQEMFLCKWQKCWILLKQVKRLSEQELWKWRELYTDISCFHWNLWVTCCWEHLCIWFTKFGFLICIFFVCIANYYEIFMPCMWANAKLSTFDCGLWVYAIVIFFFLFSFVSTNFRLIQKSVIHLHLS